MLNRRWHYPTAAVLCFCTAIGAWCALRPEWLAPGTMKQRRGQGVRSTPRTAHNLTCSLSCSRVQLALSTPNLGLWCTWLACTAMHVACTGAREARHVLSRQPTLLWIVSTYRLRDAPVNEDETRPFPPANVLDDKDPATGWWWHWPQYLLRGLACPHSWDRQELASVASKLLLS
jgi:hypothetical protein